MGVGLLLLLGLLAATGCKGLIDDPRDSGLVKRPECENINPAACLLPWPSSRYLVDDPTTLTGKRIVIPREAMPINNAGVRVAPDSLSRFDGFSPMTSMVTAVQGPVDVSSLPDQNHIQDSLSQRSPTVLLDADTGERVAHFAEVDEMASPGYQALYIRPARRLKENHRYIVALRHIHREDGTTLSPTRYFTLLRDRIPSKIPEIVERRTHMEDVFQHLEDAGVQRSDLLEAWDFRTASGASIVSDMLLMRDDALRRAGTTGFACNVTNVQEDFGSTTIFRRVDGTFTVPLYLDGTDSGARLVRGPDGNPKFVRMAQARFTLSIPWTVHDAAARGDAPTPVLVLGHGLFSSVPNVANRIIADDSPIPPWHVTALTTDWWGLTADDLVQVARGVADINLIASIPEHLMQAIINTLVMVRSFTGRCASLPALQLDTPSGPRPAFDPARVQYFGASLGGIMGTTFAALTPDVDKFALVVGGISFPVMIPRSADFAALAEVMRNNYADPLDRALLMVMTASWWDQAEPASYAPHVLHDPLPGSHPKQVLYAIGRYDAQVQNVASEMAARTMGLSLLTPSAAPVWGLPTTHAPTPSAFVVYDLGAAPLPLGPVVPIDNGVHVAMVDVPQLREQIGEFLQAGGQVEDSCGGACNVPFPSSHP